jgi:hypothetical protein
VLGPVAKTKEVRVSGIKARVAYIVDKLRVVNHVYITVKLHYHEEDDYKLVFSTLVSLRRLKNLRGMVFFELQPLRDRPRNEVSKADLQDAFNNTLWWW